MGFVGNSDVKHLGLATKALFYPGENMIWIWRYSIVDRNVAFQHRTEQYLIYNIVRSIL